MLKSAAGHFMMRDGNKAGAHNAISGGYNRLEVDPYSWPGRLISINKNDALGFVIAL